MRQELITQHFETVLAAATPAEGETGLQAARQELSESEYTALLGRLVSEQNRRAEALEAALADLEPMGLAHAVSRIETHNRQFDPTILELSEPLPCGILKPTTADPDARCGKPATAAHAYPAPEDAPNLPLSGQVRPGEWIILPVCAECNRAAVAVYGLVRE